MFWKLKQTQNNFIQRIKNNFKRIKALNLLLKIGARTRFIEFLINRHCQLFILNDACRPKRCFNEREIHMEAEYAPFVSCFLTQPYNVKYWLL